MTSADGVDTLKHIEIIADGNHSYIVGENNGVFGLGAAGSTDEDSGVDFDLFAGSFDVEGDSYSVTGVDTSDTVGSVSVSADGIASYDPGAAFQNLAVGETATDSFSYTVTDAAGNESTQTVAVTIAGVNDAPEFTGGDTVGSITLPTGSGEVEFGFHTILRANVIDDTNSSGKLDLAALDNGGYAVTSNATASANNGGSSWVSIVAPDGTETEIFQDSGLHGDGHYMVSLANGNFAAFWSEGRHYGEVKVYQPDGTEVGSDYFRAAYIDAGGALGATEDGGFVLAYRHWGTGVATRKYDADGNIVQGPMVVSSNSGGYEPAVVGTSDGGYAVSYMNGTTLELTLVDASGAVTASGIEIDADSGISTRDMGITELADGSLVISYQIFDGRVKEVFSIVDADGTAVSGRTLTSDFSTNWSTTSQGIVALDDGGFAIAYYNQYQATDPSDGESRDPGTYVQRFNADGSENGDAIFVASGGKAELTVNADGNLAVLTMNWRNAEITEVILPSDGPVVGDGDLSVSGTLTAEDVDDGALLSFASEGDGAYGSVEVDAVTGEWTYTLDPESGVADDAPAQDSFIVSVTDQHNAVDYQTVTIDIA